MASYQEALSGLNDAQKKAVTTTEGPVLVIAGPGTGKTQLLTTRIAHILATTDTLPQNILCLTFTESAAANMRERLAGMIGQGAYDVTMSTYHAFGSDLIRRFPDYFTDQADLEPADDLGMDRIFRTIIASLPFSNPLKYSDSYLSDLKTLVSDAKRALLTPDDIRAVAKENLGFIQNASPLVSKTLAGVARIDKKSIPLFAKLAEEASTLINPKESHSASRESSFGAHQGASSPQMGPDPERRRSRVRPDREDLRAAKAASEPLAKIFLEELAEALAAAEESGKTTTLTKWKNKWLAKNTGGAFIVDGLKTNQKLLAAADVYERYLKELQVRGLFDYDDMILRAVHALEAHSDLRYSLQEQYLYIMLDEFQDTNGAQLRLVELLTDNPIHEGRPNVLAVGDDDQAIYAFQGANYSHMLQFNNRYRDVVVVPLTQNYRSHADILHTARGIAEQIEERLHHHFPAIEKALTAENKKLPKESVVERREAASDVMQYSWVAKRIKQLIGQGVPASEIAVLAPQHKYLEPLVPFLQEADVPIRYEKRENVLDDPAVTQLLRMSELCIALKQGKTLTANALWSQILSFGFWELPTSTIWRLSWQTNDAHRSWTDELLDDEHLKPVALFFIRLSHLAGTETLETMLDYLIGTIPLDLQEPGYAPFRSPYYEHYFGDLARETEVPAQPSLFDKKPADEERKEFWTLLTNLIVLRARLREFRRDSEERLTLEDFIAFVEAYRAADLKILNTSPYASGTDAVQLMTAFKAKGMEWSAVFVLAVNDEAWGGKSHSASVRIALPPNLQYIRYAGATSDERLRLFYVAVTRARTQLFLMNYTSNYAGKTMTRLKYLEENADEHDVVHSPLLPPGKQIVLPAEDGTPEPSTELAAYWQQRHQDALATPDMRALIASRLADYQLSPTHVNDFIDLTHCGPQMFFMRTILRFPQAPRAEGEFGSAMHETMEWLHNTARQSNAIPREADVYNAFDRRMRARQINEQDLPLFIERGQTALRAYLQQRRDAITPDVVAEYSFRKEGVFVGDAHMAGKIDKMIIDRAERTITIVDYKTGRSYNRWIRDLKLHKYRMQLYLYRALVEGSHTYAGYRVVDAYLEFIEPDEDGNIQTLHLQFDEAEYEAAKKLAEIVYTRVRSMDLPDTSTYTKDLSGVESFQKDLQA